MPPTQFVSHVLGTLLGLCSGASFAVNLAILIVLLRSKLPKSNPIYLLSAMNLFSDCLQNAGILLFLTPTSITQDYILPMAQPNQPIWLIFMFIFQIQWYSALLILISMALNRLVAIAFPRKSYLIDKFAVKCIALCIFPLATFLTFIADFVLPCCRTNYSFTFFSYQFFAWKSANESEINYKNWMMDLPLNIFTSVVLFICYGIIFLKVLKTNRSKALQNNRELAQSRRIAEIRYAVQFALISSFFIAAWVSFRILPMIVSKNEPQWYSLTAFFEIGNCSANALIYLTMNKEVKQHFLSFYGAIFGYKIPINPQTVAAVTKNVVGLSPWIGLKKGHMAVTQIAKGHPTTNKHFTGGTY